MGLIRQGSPDARAARCTPRTFKPGTAGPGKRSSSLRAHRGPPCPRTRCRGGKRRGLGGAVSAQGASPSSACVR
eukprot:364915-Chlamydomonas_euryale.AAC.8